jgi:hypothetical protein
MQPKASVFANTDKNKIVDLNQLLSELNKQPAVEPIIKQEPKPIMPKLNQKYQVTPLRREVVYEATEAVVNLPIEDMHNIAVMDSEDFFN